MTPFLEKSFLRFCEEFRIMMQTSWVSVRCSIKQAELTNFTYVFSNLKAKQYFSKIKCKHVSF
jgi:hypothetical protein